jgi:hypothetical protein
MNAGMIKRFGSVVATTALAAGLALALGAANAGASTASRSAALPTVTIALDGKSITVGGTLQSGAVNLVSTVSKVALAEPTLLHLNPGATFAQAFAAAATHNGDPNYLNPYGSIVFDANANRGSNTAQTTLAPGNYEALDTEGQNPRKWPHVAFTVTQSTAPASLPKPQATVAAIDFHFRAPATLHDGQLVRFENDGFLVHMIAATAVKNASDARKLTALLLAGKDNKAQKLAIGFAFFAGPLSSGGIQQFVVNAQPGIYVLSCFMNSQDGREHTQLGMERTIKIVK